jgi:hypothetical protein
MTWTRYRFVLYTGFVLITALPAFALPKCVELASNPGYGLVRIGGEPGDNEPDDFYCACGRLGFRPARFRPTET